MTGVYRGGQRYTGDDRGIQGMTGVYRGGQRICSGHDSGRHGVQWI